MQTRKVLVLTLDIPQMLQTILDEALSEAGDFDVTIDARSSRPSARMLRKTDMVICSVQTLQRLPSAAQKVPRLLGLGTDGSGGVFCRQGEDPVEIDDLSRSTLIALLRDIPMPQAERTTGWWSWLCGARYTPKSRAPTQPTHAHELTRIAQIILNHRSAAHASDGPVRHLMELAQNLAPKAEALLPPSPRMAEVATRFGLTSDERDLLSLTCLVEVDESAAQLVALLNDHMQHRRPTIGLSSDLGGDPVQISTAMVSNGPLSKYRLVDVEGDGPLVARTLRASPAVWSRALDLGAKPDFPEVDVSKAELTGIGLNPAQIAQIEHDLAPFPTENTPPILAIVGDRGVGRSQIARHAARRFGPFAVTATTEVLSEPDMASCLARDALFAGGAAIITCADSTTAPDWAKIINADFPAPVIAIVEPSELPALALGMPRPVTKITAPQRDLAQRRRIWRATAQDVSDTSVLDGLAERFDFGLPEVKRAVGMAKTTGHPDLSNLRAACETLRDTKFEGMAERLHCPFDPGDIVLAPDTRAELELTTIWARHGADLFSEAGRGAALRAGGGLACLFSGPPGVGKTMAAQIVAREVDYALYRIDISQVINKFIGESEKRLAALFDEAERSRVALFFDEADALFGKRTEVRDSHDRYANITVDFLLQRIESFSGFAILATNFSSNIDEAFLRRVRVRAEFSPPDAEDRARIWSKLLPGPDARNADIDINLLAGSFELVGGEIRNAVYTAHLLAAKDEQTIAMSHCVRGLWRELRKVGRITDPDSFGVWIDELRMAG